MPTISIKNLVNYLQIIIHQAYHRAYLDSVFYVRSKTWKLVNNQRRERARERDRKIHRCNENIHRYSQHMTAKQSYKMTTKNASRIEGKNPVKIWANWTEKKYLTSATWKITESIQTSQSIEYPREEEQKLCERAKNVV